MNDIFSRFPYNTQVWQTDRRTSPDNGQYRATHSVVR